MEVRIKNYLKGPYSLVHEDGSIETHDAPVPSKWLPGDLIGPSGIVRNTPSPLVGVVDFLNRTGQGFSPRGVPLYLFHPYDPAWPPFLVSSKTKSDTNIVALVSYEHWDCAWPRGGIMKRLGAVGDKTVERSALLYRSGVKSNVSEEVDCFPDSDAHETSEWDFVFNIDPTGCKDVDDVFAWRTVNGKTEFAIAIADVSAFVAVGSDLDVAAKKKGLTCYENGTPIQPMLPTMLSEVRASLRADGRARPTVARVYTLCGTKVESVRWALLSLTVQHAYSYESVLDDADVAKKLPELLTICLNHCWSSAANDPHEWVAAAMIDYNTAAGELLKSAGLGLLRRHAGMTNAAYTDLADRSGCAAISMLGMAAGEYCAASSIDCAHAGLGISAYAHASSPLRRYADLVNQRWIKYLVFGGLAPSFIDERRLCFDLNTAERRFKALERDLWFLSKVEPGAITEAEGIVIEYKKEKWTVYVTEWRRKVRGVCAYELEPGKSVKVRAFADLRRPAWTERIVVQII
jgi:exoribonuclease R